MKNSINKIYALLFAAVLFFAANNSYSANVDLYNNAVFTGGYASLDLALAQVGVVPNTGAVQVRINIGHALTTSATIGNSNFISCKIFPTAAVTLTSALNASMILLSTADNVTIDGRLNGADVIGNGNSLTLTNTNAGTGVRCIQTQNGSQNSTVRNVNCNIPVIVTAVGGGRCINIGQSTTALQGGQDNVTVKYCNMSGGDRTFQTFGSAGFNANINQTIFGNKVRNASSLGLFIGSDVLNVTIDSNEIYDDTPVYKGGAAGTTSRSIGMQAIGTILIQNNKIHDIADNGIRATGMSLQGILSIPFRSAAPLATPTTNVTVQNNFVSLGQPNTAVTSIYGIFMSNLASPSGLDHNARVYNNTSLIGGTGSATLQQFTYGLIFDIPDAASANSPSSATYYNNVSRNLREGNATSQHVGMDFEVEPLVTTVSDYNTCYSDGLTGIRYDATDAAFGYNSTSSWRDANCPDYEQQSAFRFVNYNANCQLTAPNYGDLNGKVLASVPKDLFGNTRAAVYPYRGAVEDIANPLKVLTVTASLEARAGALKSQMTIVLYDLLCNPIDYATSYIINGSSTAEFVYSTAVTNNAPQYYLKCLTATNMESWSKNTVTFSSGTANYQFLSNTDIYGDNGTLSGAFFAADVNQDGIIDGTDMSLVDNDATLSANGCRVPTDINGDGFVDGSDLSFVDNNAVIGYSSIGPCPNLAANTDKINMNLNNVERVRLSSDSKVKFREETSHINK
ncbi:MAG: hypothetical protein IPG78_12945 [Ignavibacteria bacterium]|nr:hypothetical protein [Ignavibacteria bacterium]